MKFTWHHSPGHVHTLKLTPQDMMEVKLASGKLKLALFCRVTVMRTRVGLPVRRRITLPQTREKKRGGREILRGSVRETETGRSGMSETGKEAETGTERGTGAGSEAERETGEDSTLLCFCHRCLLV